jgi:hypothetical protein
MNNHELQQLAKELFLHRGLIKICPCNQVNSINFYEFLDLKEILKSMGSEAVLEYDSKTGSGHTKFHT